MRRYIYAQFFAFFGTGVGFFAALFTGASWTTAQWVGAGTGIFVFGFTYWKIGRDNL